MFARLYGDKLLEYSENVEIIHSKRDMFIYHSEVFLFMLNPNERDKLKNRDALSPKARANLDYRIAQKAKGRLLELDDINRTLCSIPEKNARRILDDRMVVSIFRLTENMLRILRYVPVEEGPMSCSYVTHSEEMPSKDDVSQEFKIRIQPATKEDMARHYLLKEHIEKLQSFANPDISAPVRPHGTVYELPKGIVDGESRVAGYNLFHQWQERR